MCGKISEPFGRMLTTVCHITVRCRYNTVNFLPNPQNRHPISRPWGRGMGCLLWVSSLNCVLLLSSQCRWYRDKWERAITALDCMCIPIGAEIVLFQWCTEDICTSRQVETTLCNVINGSYDRIDPFGFIVWAIHEKNKAWWQWWVVGLSASNLDRVHVKCAPNQLTWTIMW